MLQLARGWDTWLELHLWRLRRMRLLQRGLSKLLAPKMVACFGVWLADARDAERRALEAAARDAAERLERERELAIEKLLKVAGHTFGKVTLVKGWRTWHDKYTVWAKAHLLLRRVAGRLLHGALARGYATWAGNASARLRRRRLAMRGYARLTRPRLAASFQCWHADWSEAETTRRFDAKTEFAIAAALNDAAERVEAEKAAAVRDALEQAAREHAAALAAAVAAAKAEATAAALAASRELREERAQLDALAADAEKARRAAREDGYAALLYAVQQEMRLRARLANLEPNSTLKFASNNRFKRYRYDAAMASIQGMCRRWLCKRARRKLREAEAKIATPLALRRQPAKPLSGGERLTLAPQEAAPTSRAAGHGGRLPASAWAAALEAVRQEWRLRARLAALHPASTYKLQTKNTFVRHRREAAMQSIEGACRNWLCRRARSRVTLAFEGVTLEPSRAPAAPAEPRRAASTERASASKANEVAALQRQLIDAKRQAADLRRQAAAAKRFEADVAALQAELRDSESQLVTAKLDLAQIAYEKEQLKLQQRRRTLG